MYTDLINFIRDLYGTEDFIPLHAPTFTQRDKDTMGLSPDALEAFLTAHAVRRDSGAYNRHTHRRIAATLPMHTFGHPCRIEQIVAIAKVWSIPVVEDAAEAIGSWSGQTHCGLFGDLGVLSFNSNKTMTCGGGGHCRSCIDVIEQQGRFAIAGIIDLPGKQHRMPCSWWRPGNRVQETTGESAENPCPVRSGSPQNGEPGQNPTGTD
jgi:hypothetical protein